LLALETDGELVQILSALFGAKCKRMAELGLAGDGTLLRRKDRSRCGARTRKGTP
jgi:hypothetical protein